MKKLLKKVIHHILCGRFEKFVQANISYTTPYHRLKGKKIIVTGGGRGLGFYMAKKFIEEDAEVLIAGRDVKTLEKASKSLKCHYLQLDVKDVASFNDFISQANSILGGCNCLVNNAGVSFHESSFTDVSLDDFNEQFNINLRGGFFLSQAFVRLLNNNNCSGNLLFVSSETGNVADIRPYGLTKAAINSLVRGLAVVYASKGFRVNAIAPGVTASDMTGYQHDGNLFVNNSPIERVYLPEEIAECACFLLSDVSGCVSGEILTCNNGKTINSRVR